MITPSFGLTATERVLPKLALDFTTASLDSRVTFTRALATATVTNSSGVIVGVAADTPRFDYNPVTLVCKGLLIEEARINLATYSDDFSQSAWNKSNVTPSYNAVISPDGTQNADEFLETAATGEHGMNNNFGVTITAGTNNIASFYIKANGRTKGTIKSVIGSFGTQVAADFDLTAGTIGAAYQAAGSGSTQLSSSISNAGNGWYRISVGAILDGVSTNIKSQVVFSNGSTTNYAGDVTKGMYIWGAQIETGAFPTSYIPTTSGSVLRNADVATMTGTNFSSWWVATNGASDIWLTPKSTSTLAYMSFDDNTANNKIIIANSTTSGQSTITSGGTLQATLTAGTITANTTNKVGCSWNTNNCAATANATNPATTTSATIPTVTQLRIGSNGTAYANAWIQKLFYWPQRITNNEIQAFTK